ncbi:RCC1 and BTB domain-containing protein 1-like isoform X2 [Hylaeus anthracinus]|uniref:RCC1 and BTB domain-containing protein 1-like isoform X2 n=1 Tax=Hylaeus anthracinus TaxID=313031 RepID=UPI0023B90E20|nr:RCC1 and BTB domain-containing protein 1-like isoform X2 [Hylaeus anthracinus]
MISRNLKKWPIFSLLESTFISNIQMTIVYGDIGNEALIVTKDGMVYGIGCNACGCLGINDNHSTLHPKKVEALCKRGIKTFAHGKSPHVLALTMDGQVYSWGYNDSSQLGCDHTNQTSIPTVVQNNLSKKFIVDIACGHSHCLALTDNGEVYAWGLNDHGQVGAGFISTQNVPTKVKSILTGKKIVCISCGDSSSIAVTDNGEVYSWGDNGVGQLGIGNYVDQVTPCKVTTLAEVVIALSDEGVLYVWGANCYGQLGNGTDWNVSIPTKLEVPEIGKVLDIATSSYNNISIAMAVNNRVFMWGQCLGQSIKIPTLTPQKCLHDALACYAWPSVMHQPLILSNEKRVNLIDCLKESFDDPVTSDLTIEVQGKPIHVHKSILKIRCHYFRTMFQEHWVENNQSVIEHDQFSYDVYRNFLKYLYTDEIELDVENGLELLDLANAYSESHLKRRCIQMIKKEITVTNVIPVYSRSIKYDTKELEEFCFKYAMNHMTAVINDSNFAKLDESTVKDFIIKAAQAGAFKT